MPHSLRAKIKSLRYKGILTDKDCDRLCKALDNENVLDKIEKAVSDKLTVTFDSSLDDESGICVSRVVNGKTVVLKMELGEQADILYRLLTEQMTRAKIKTESEKVKKYCKDCVHLHVDRMIIDKNGKVRGGGVCYNNKKACRCYDNTKLNCVFSRQACANFEPKESEDKE